LGGDTQIRCFGAPEAVPVFTKNLRISSAGENDVVDLTLRVREAVRGTGLSTGIVIVFVSGSTGAVTTMEYEPGLVQDFPRMLERVSPRSIAYEHQKAWNDYNGHSHVKASLVGPSLTVPFVDGELALGTWQQVVFIELDTRPRERNIVLQVIGE
jgi:secondary thiamine-phosphate synthase enzyme